MSERGNSYLQRASEAHGKVDHVLVLTNSGIGDGGTARLGKLLRPNRTQ